MCKLERSSYLCHDIFFLLRDYLAKKLKEQRQVFFNDNMAVVLINNTNR